jgi:hypothetical protein
VATKAQIVAAVEIVRLVAESIRLAGSLPSGNLYAQVMGVLTLDQYDRIIGILTRAGLVRLTSAHVLEWVG